MTDLRCGRCGGSNLKLKGLPMEADGHMVFYCSDCLLPINFVGGSLGNVLPTIRSSARDIRQLKDDLLPTIQMTESSLTFEIQAISDDLSLEIQAIKDILLSEIQAVRDDLLSEIRAVESTVKKVQSQLKMMDHTMF